VGVTRNSYKIVEGKPEGKIPLRRPRHRYEDNITLDIKETGCEGVEWIQLAQGKVQWCTLENRAMNHRVP
jgi:hypothetical protein